MSSRRLIYRGAVQDVGRVRVTWSDDWAEYCARVTDSTGDLVGEYFTDDRRDAIATGERMLEDFGRRLTAS